MSKDILNMQNVTKSFQDGMSNRVILAKLIGRGNWGMNLHYFNQSLNKKIASFPWWDNADKDISILCISDIPLGTLRNPFNDCEQSWQILIWEKRDYVYIMQGDDPCCSEFHIWFRVRKENCLAEWEKMINNFH